MLVQWATNPDAWFLQHVSVNHRCFDMLVPHQLLNSSNIAALLQKVRRE